MRRHRFSYAVSTEPAFSEINTTPMIDVLLVLLILCIISVPVMNHKVMIQLPQTGPVVTQAPTVYHLTLDASGRIGWNGAPVTLASLPAYLETIERDPRNQLEIMASGNTRYEDFDRMIAVVKRSGIERIDFVGHAAFANTLDAR